MLRGKQVYVRTTANGEPDVSRDGRVDIKYKAAGGAKIYRASARNLETSGDPADDRPIDIDETGDQPADAATPSARGQRRKGSKSGRGTGATARAPATPPAGSLIIYTDGACTGNPGPAGIGVVIIDGDERQEISEYLGVGTNNIAELTAIERALQATWDRRDRAVYVHSDSSYSLGLLTKGWKAKANQALVARLRELADSFPNLAFVKVKGHAGIPENERADELARIAVELRR